MVGYSGFRVIFYSSRYLTWEHSPVHPLLQQHCSALVQPSSLSAKLMSCPAKSHRAVSLLQPFLHSDAWGTFLKRLSASYLSSVERAMLSHLYTSASLAVCSFNGLFLSGLPSSTHYIIQNSGPPLSGLGPLLSFSKVPLWLHFFPEFTNRAVTVGLLLSSL